MALSEPARLSAALARSALVAALAAACAEAPPPPVGSPEAPAAAFGWRTMRAEHRVTVVARDAEGQRQIRRLRGLFLAERGGRFRVRALGPADLTLFDLVGDAERCQLLEAARPPPQGLVDSLCADLRAAYRLGPPGRPGPTADADVRYDDWREVAGRPVAFTIWIRDRRRGYEATIRAVSVELDVPLPAAALPALLR